MVFETTVPAPNPETSELHRGIQPHFTQVLGVTDCGLGLPKSTLEGERPESTSEVQLSPQERELS